MKKICCCLLFLLVSSLLFALSKVGEWRAHLSYENTEMILASHHKIYAVADGHVFSVDKKDKQMTTYSKINGWSENVLQCFAYCPALFSL